MTLSEIRQEAWDIARETATTDEDRLWTTAEMNRYINRIYRWIARETKCIRDSAPSAITHIHVDHYADYAALVAAAVTDPYAQQDIDYINSPNSWFYVAPTPADTYAARLDAMAQKIAPYVFPLSPLILDIDECKWTTLQWRLTKVSVNKWQVNPWWEQVTGMPTEYCTDYCNNKLAINFRYDGHDALRLVVRRLPLADLSADDDIPELRTHYHDYFVNGVLWQMYSKQDAETIDLKKANDYYIQFMADIDEIKQQETILDQRLKPNHSMDAFR